jgi:hypothetical protein
MSFKYVIVSGAYPFILSEASCHADLKNMNITSAGFGQMGIEDGRVHISVYGSSISLGIPSLPDDGILLEQLFNPAFGGKLC